MAEAKTVLVDVGWLILKLTRAGNGHETLTLISPEEHLESVHLTAQQIQLRGRQDIDRLLKVLTDWADERLPQPF